MVKQVWLGFSRAIAENLRVGSALLAVAALLSLLAGCSSNPWKHRPFVATSYPTDFALQIIENYATSVSHQYVQQTISAKSMKSVTIFSTVRPDGAAIISQTAIVRHVTVNQLQAMWNAIRKHKLMQGAGLWDFWHSASDRYISGAQMLEIRAADRRVLIHQLYHWNNNVADLVLLCEPLQLPSPGQKPIVTTNNPAAANAEPEPISPQGARAAMPAPATIPAATSQPAAK